MLTKKSNGAVSRPRMQQALASVVGSSVDRRTFLKRSGLMAGGAALATVPLGAVQKAEAQGAAGSAVKMVKSVCTHCSVGCTVMAEVDRAARRRATSSTAGRSRVLEFSHWLLHLRT
jgi:formate dehydrogenase major subunit